MRPSLILFILFSILLNAGCSEQSPQSPQSDVVLVSVKPVQLVLQPITDGIIDTDLLSPDNHTPHQVTLGFSQQRALRNASGLVWMGPVFEPYLEKALPEELPAYNFPVDGVNDHFWLDAQRLQAALPDLTAFIVALKPDAESLLQQRMQQQSAMLAKLEKNIEEKLSALNGLRVFSGHGGVAALLARHNIELVASLDSAAHAGISLQQAREYRAMVERGEVACLLLEHPERENKLQTLFEGLPLRIVKLDLLAYESQTYQQYMMAIADKLLHCQS